MNTGYIVKRVAEMVPALADCRVEDAGRGVFAFHAKREGLARVIQFDECGIYGMPAWLGRWAQSDDAIAVALAVELSK